MRKSLILLACTSAVLGGCFQPMKPSDGHLRDTPTPATAAVNIPAPVQAPPVITPPKPAPKAETYSVVVDRMPAQQLLFALARDAKLNIDVHPGINGTVTLNAIDQTLPQILNRVSKQIDMRYEFDGPNLIVMPDSPYLRVYKIDYVNMSRESDGIVSASGEINSTGSNYNSGSGSSSGSSTASGNRGSTNSSTIIIKNKSTNNFWMHLEQNVKDILRETDKILPTENRSVQAPAATQAVNPAPVVPSVTYREAASVIVNPEAGILSIRATARQHEKIQEFLDQVLASVKRQVLLEATIVEVQLSNDYQQGIDWAVLSGSSGFQLLGGGLYRNPVTTPGLQLPVPTVGTLSALPTGNLFAGQYNSENFRATLQLLETFGNVRVLSSPRISVINNQTAILKVVDNLVYFTVEADTTALSENSNIVTYTTTPQTVSVGFIMNVTPQISEDDTVLLNIKPTIRRKVGDVQDPNPGLTIDNFVPLIRERELESVLKLSSGQIGVMGGLIEDSLQDNTDSLPLVNRLPFLGNLFSNKNMQNRKSELVIFVRPVVVRDPSVRGDYNAYSRYLPGDNFTNQPHPTKPATLDWGNSLK